MITFSQRNFSGLVLIQVQLYWTWTRYDNEIVKKKIAINVNQYLKNSKVQNSLTKLMAQN